MSKGANRLRARWKRTLTVLRAPRIRIEAYGDARARERYLSFTARHPRYKVMASKRWGVALLQLPDTFDEYLGRSSSHLRRKHRRAEAAGFRYAVVTPQDHVDDILEINRSAPIRQGRQMSESYLDRQQVERSFEGQSAIHGVIDGDGQLRAYAVTITVGDACTFVRLLGHADDLERGIMYLLISEVVRTCIDVRRTNGSPRWLMYDTFWGANEGLAYFKERMGFRPYTVDWVWLDRSVAAPSRNEEAPAHELDV
jgi:hypothetical protein